QILKTGLSRPIESLRRYHADENLTVWVLIDDVDAKYRDTSENQERIGAFFSAIRSLAFGVKNLRIRASVRTDVWYNLRQMEDQDKLRQYVIDINWKDETLRLILAKKILSYIHRHELNEINKKWDVSKNYSDIMSYVFEKTFLWGNRREDPFVPLKILAGARPRWMGQLCKLAGEKSKNHISMGGVLDVMREFGKDKFSDLKKEHAHQFADLDKLVESFRGGEREYSRYQLLKRIQIGYIQKVKGVVPDVDGYTYINENEDSAMAGNQLGEFLFKIEMISAKRGGDERFILYQDDPELFLTEENNQNKINWAITPSYRNYLGIR
ncbi:MAG: P-loop ATPase, Sll1717 family, partial [Gallionellaceae bacterium]